MEAVVFNATELKKEIMRSKAVANFNHYKEGKLYYDFEVPSGKYLVPVDVVAYQKIKVTDEDGNESEAEQISGLASDVGNGVFDSQMKASLLNLWVDKAIKNEKLAKI